MPESAWPGERASQERLREWAASSPLGGVEVAHIDRSATVAYEDGHVSVRNGRGDLLALIPFLENPEEGWVAASEVASLLRADGVVVEILESDGRLRRSHDI